mmetsp:Transcript_4708/g.11908  ORF Transcript_4708/g.11908 Transcript_4708/m.11908 type:complete len:273 (+) Transcript_4708:77-895(+)
MSAGLHGLDTHDGGLHQGDLLPLFELHDDDVHRSIQHHHDDSWEHADHFGGEAGGEGGFDGGGAQLHNPAGALCEAGHVDGMDMINYTTSRQANIWENEKGTKGLAALGNPSGSSSGPAFLGKATAVAVLGQALDADGKPKGLSKLEEDNGSLRAISRYLMQEREDLMKRSEKTMTIAQNMRALLGVLMLQLGNMGDTDADQHSGHHDEPIDAAALEAHINGMLAEHDPEHENPESADLGHKEGEAANHAHLGWFAEDAAASKEVDVMTDLV